MSVYAMIGRRRQGKSTLMRFTAERVPARLVFDPRRMFRGDPTAPVTTHQVVATTREEFQLACDRLFDQEVPEVVYSPVGDLDEGFLHYAAEMKRWIQNAPGRPIAFMIDEANQDFIDTNVADFQWAMRCCTWEVHHIMLTTHRPTDLPTKVRALVDHWCLFAVRQEHDLEMIRKRCGPEVATIVQQLPARHFVHWDDTDAVYEVKSDPEEWRRTIGSPIQIELPDDEEALGTLTGTGAPKPPQGSLW